MHPVAPARLSPSAPPPVLDVVAATCLIAGNTLGGYVWRPETRVAGLYPLVWAGLGLVAIRCVVWREPSLFATSWRRVAGRGLTRSVLLVALVTRLAVLAAGFAVSVARHDDLAKSPRISTNPAVTLPARWDGFWYLDIARYGYEWLPSAANQQQNIAFFPAYPFVMRVAGDLLTYPAYLLNAPGWFGNGDGRVIWGGVFASLLLFTLALSRIHTLAADDTGSIGAATRTCVLVAAYPFALFFSAPYSESLALFALASLVLAWRRQDPIGTVWGIVFGLCRSNGWCVAAALAADRLLRPQPRSSRRVAWMLIGAAPLGAALYSLYMYHLTGHPFEWAAAQHAWGGHFQPLAFITRRWQAIGDRGFRIYYRRDPVDVYAFAAAVSMIATGAWLIARREWLYGVLMLAYLAPAVAIDLPAIGRMTALLFPAFIVLGRRLKGPWFVAVTIAFGALQLWFACRFFLWKTPY